jgi:protein-L-isoaspartate(D-aspartate) O-methyltransferase
VSETTATDGYSIKRRLMVERLQRNGIADTHVLAALRDVPRHVFVDEALAAKAYGDYSLPIGQSQTISNPATVAGMLQLLELESGHRLLEIGTGCGYLTALASRLSRHVYSIERLAPLGVRARKALRQVHAVNVSLRIGDGTLGWPVRAPFDRIIASAAGERVPQALVDQLAPGGRLVLPVGTHTKQRLQLIQRLETGIVQEDQGACAFVEFVDQQGRS